MKTYHKIPALFCRDEKTHKVINQFRDPEVEYLKNCEWLFTEKIDGTNIRVHWDGHKVLFGGRTDNASIPARLIDRLNQLFKEEIFEQVFGETAVTLYGEGYGGKIQKGGKYKEKEDFILFDVIIGEMFLKREDIEDISRKLGLECVKSFGWGTLQYGIDLVKNNQVEGICKEESEGIIGIPKCNLRKRNGDRIIVKIKSKDIKELV
jgi:ATP-dependent RNA circularization protein (DNA/RNA ligase family)